MHRQEVAVKGRKPEYPTLLELIRGRAKRAAIAGSSAAVIATVGCSSTGGTGGGMPVPDMGWKDEDALVEDTTDLPVETDNYIPLAGYMEWDVHEPGDPDAKDGK